MSNNHISQNRVDFFFFLYSDARHTRLFLQRNYGTTFKKWNWHYGCYQLYCAIAYCKNLIETTWKISVKGHCWAPVAWKWSFRDPRRLIFSKHRSHFNIKIIQWKLQRFNFWKAQIIIYSLALRLPYQWWFPGCSIDSLYLVLKAKSWIGSKAPFCIY